MIIVSVADDKYAQHLGIMIISLLENTQEKNICFYIIDNGISVQNKKKLKLTVKKYRSILIFLKAEINKYKDFGIRDNMTHTVYNKLSISRLLPKNIDKVLYLDSDMIIKVDIKKLWEINIENYVMAAVLEPEFDRHKQLKLDLDHKYFNSGVMLINLNLWREQKVSERAYDFLINNSYRIKLHDQDAFNVCIKKEEIISLPQKWNQRSVLFNIKNPLNTYEKDEFNEAIKNPFIIHYTRGDTKPWRYFAEHPFSSEYIKYLNISLWKDYQPYEKKLMENKKIIIFGTGSASIRVEKKIKFRKASYYVDNDRNKWYEVHNDKIVYPPKVLLREVKGEFLIIIASVFYDEIKLQLEKYNYVENQDFISGLGKR